MTTHTITLARHTAQVVGLMGVLVLGTWDSYGTEQLLLRHGPEWDGLAIDATFHNVPNDEGVTVLADTDGLVPVPPEACMRASKYATITIRGVQDGVQRISCNLPYMVLDHAQVPGANSTATPSEIAQALTQMQDLRDGAVDAKRHAEAARDAAANSATAAAGDAKTASDAAAGAADAKAAAVAAQKDAAASKAAAANSSVAAKTSEDAAAKSAADADSTANSINNSMMQIAANKEAVSQLKETSATQEQIADLDSRMLKSEEIVLFQRNLINVNNIINGKYIDDQGNLKDDADYSVTDYEFVKPNTTYTFWRFGKSYKFGQNAFYTKDKKFISYLRDVRQWKSPSNAYYVRMSMPTTYFTSGNPIVCKGTDYTGDTTYQNEYKTVVNHYVTREEIAKVNIPDMVESDTLSILTINASNSKKNNLIGFEANFSTMGSVRIAHGTSYDANRSASIVVDATNIYLYDKSTNLRATYPHGLTMSKFITVSIVVGQMRTAKIILTTANGRFIQDSVFWGGCREDVTAQAISGTFTNARLTWYVPDYNHDLWAFGDSYFDFWVADVIQNLGYHNFMSDGFGGRRSTGAFISLKLALEKAIPKKILWCLGMNDPDTEDSINAEWKTTVDNLINLCDEKGIELILCTIPITPVTEHKYKNAYVKASGKRYVDVCHAVGADISPEWYDGMRTNTETDKIHPTNPLGTRTIADYMLENVPELAN